MHHSDPGPDDSGRRLEKVSGKTSKVLILGFFVFLFVVQLVNSDFHPSGVGKSSTGLTGWGEGGVCSLVSGSR